MRVCLSGWGIAEAARFTQVFLFVLLCDCGYENDFAYTVRWLPKYALVFNVPRIGL